MIKIDNNVFRLSSINYVSDIHDNPNLKGDSTEKKFIIDCYGISYDVIESKNISLLYRDGRSKWIDVPTKTFEDIKTQIINMM